MISHALLAARSAILDVTEASQCALLARSLGGIGRVNREWQGKWPDESQDLQSACYYCTEQFYSTLHHLTNCGLFEERFSSVQFSSARRRAEQVSSMRHNRFCVKADLIAGREHSRRAAYQASKCRFHAGCTAGQDPRQLIRTATAPTPE